MADARRLGARRHAARPRGATGRQGAHHPDQQRRRQRAHHRPGHEPRRRRNHRHRGRPRRGRRARRQPPLREQRGRYHAGRRGRPLPAGDQPHSLERSPQQRRREPRRCAGVRRHPSGARRGRCDRHRVAAAGEEHSRQGRGAQHLRHARRPFRDCRIDCRQEPHRDRSADGTAGVDPRLRSRGASDGVRAERRRLDPPAVRAVDGVQRVRRRGLCGPPRGGPRGAAADRRRQEAGLRGRQQLARDGGDGRQPPAGRRQPVEQRRLRLLPARFDTRRRRGRRRGSGLGDADPGWPHGLRGQRRLQLRIGGGYRGDA